MRGNKQKDRIEREFYSRKVHRCGKNLLRDDALIWLEKYSRYSVRSQVLCTLGVVSISRFSLNIPTFLVRRKKGKNFRIGEFDVNNTRQRWNIYGGLRAFSLSKQSIGREAGRRYASRSVHFNQAYINADPWPSSFMYHPTSLSLYDFLSSSKYCIIHINIWLHCWLATRSRPNHNKALSLALGQNTNSINLLVNKSWPEKEKELIDLKRDLFRKIISIEKWHSSTSGLKIWRQTT